MPSFMTIASTASTSESRKITMVGGLRRMDLLRDHAAMRSVERSGWTKSAAHCAP
jgi:hypothetical protein